jgi:hypothetical protein
MKPVCVFGPLMKASRAVDSSHKKMPRLQWLSGSRGFVDKGIHGVVRQWGLFLAACTTSRRTTHNRLHLNKPHTIKTRLKRSNPYWSRLHKIPTCVISLITSYLFNNKRINTEDEKTQHKAKLRIHKLASLVEVFHPFTSTCTPCALRTLSKP